MNEGVQIVQADIDATNDWADEWLMQLNDGKCAVVHMGKRNPNIAYTIRKRVVERRDTFNLHNRQFDSVFISDGNGEFSAFESRTPARLHGENVAAAMTRYQVTKFLSGLCLNKSIKADVLHPSVLRYCADA